MVVVPEFEEFAKMVADVADVAEPGPADNFVEIGGDSLAALQIAIVAEERWGAEIDVSEMVFAETVGEIHQQLVRSIEDRAGSRPGAR